MTTIGVTRNDNSVMINEKSFEKQRAIDSHSQNLEIDSVKKPKKHNFLWAIG